MMKRVALQAVERRGEFLVLQGRGPDLVAGIAVQRQLNGAVLQLPR